MSALSPAMQAKLHRQRDPVFAALRKLYATDAVRRASDPEANAILAQFEALYSRSDRGTRQLMEQFISDSTLDAVTACLRFSFSDTTPRLSAVRKLGAGNP